ATEDNETRCTSKLTSSLNDPVGRYEMRHLIILSALLATPAYAQQGISEAHMASIRSAAAECGAVVSVTRRADTVVMAIRDTAYRAHRGPVAGQTISSRQVPLT